MRQLIFCLAAVLGLAVMSSCGSVVIGGSDNATESTQTAEETNDNQVDLDCDDLMQKLADSCFKVTAFKDDGTTPLRMVDEAGNDLGEVDQKWAASYCECYAQLAFQTYGCQDVSKHQDLADEEYDKLYAPIISSCTTQEVDNAVENGAAETNTETAPTEPAPAEAAPAEPAPAETAPTEPAPAETAPADAAPAAADAAK